MKRAKTINLYVNDCGDCWASFPSRALAQSFAERMVRDDGRALSTWPELAPLVPRIRPAWCVYFARADVEFARTMLREVSR
jgi:hypothetical protein